jgi:hypothetical protein
MRLKAFGRTTLGLVFTSRAAEDFHRSGRRRVFKACEESIDTADEIVAWALLDDLHIFLEVPVVELGGAIVALVSRSRWMCS